MADFTVIGRGKFTNEILDQLEVKLKELSLSSSLKENIHICLTEAVANAVSHGNKSNPEKYVSLEMANISGKIIFKVRDEGDGFDVSTLEDPTEESRITQCGGRGLYIINRLCDNYSFDPSTQTLTLIFEC